MQEITDIKDIQSIALNILIYVDDICKKNNIRYSLAGGTAIGAIRHKGFIPWDDDIDIMMPRPDYEKFLKIMDNSENKNFKALHYGANFPNYFYGFTKVVDLNTKLYESTLINNPDLGVFIDVFPIDGAPHNINKLLKKYKKYQSLTTLASMKKFAKSSKGKLRTLLKFPSYLFAKIFGWKFWYKRKLKIIEKCDYDKCDKSIILDDVCAIKALMDKNIYDEYINVPFENCNASILKDYDIYLTSIYGDYMTPPPKEKQIAPHIFKIYRK